MEREPIGLPDVGAPAPSDDPVAAAAGLARLQRALFGRRRLPPRLARYLLLQRLSAGGMGVVYRAYDPELDRAVAIKLVEAVPGDPQTTERRLAEAHALAALSHPNVVRIYDVGTYDGAEAAADPEVAALLPSGGMFLVLELVDGRPLGAWAAQGEHGWAEIRDAYVQAGRGLMAAHAAGLVHHDFKPANAVRGHDGRVRVLDFGLAREAGDPSEAPSRGTDDDEPSRGAVTRAGAHTRAAGTPLYMAPEQHEGGATGPATDQFSFCVALYEALYQQLPFEGDTAAALARRKREGQAEPTTGRGVPGWLGRAVLRGLAYDPRDRWPSMDALVDALQRDRRRSTRGRQALGLALGGALAAGALGLAYRDDDRRDACDDPAAALQGVWDPAREAQLQAAFEAVPRAYASTTWRMLDRQLDDYRDAWISSLEALCRPEPDPALDDALQPLARACLMQRRRELLAVVDTLAEADAGTVDHAQDTVEGLRSLRGCDDPAQLQLTEVLPRDPERRAAVEEAYGSLARARALRVAGREDDAVALAESVRAQAETLDYPPLRAEALRHVAVARTAAGDERGGHQALRDSIAVAIATNNHEAAAWAWIDLVLDEISLGAGYTAAQELIPVAEQAVARMHDGPMQTSWLNAVGGLHLYGGDVERGLIFLREAEQRLDDDGFGIARQLRVRENLALALAFLEQWDVAEQRLRPVIDRIVAHYGPGHPDEAVARTNLATIALNLDRPLEAIEQARTAVQIMRDVYGHHPRIATALTTMAESHYHRGELDQAREAALAALAEADHVEGAAESSRGGALHLLADLEKRAGNLAQARRYRARSVLLHERQYGPDGARTFIVRLDLAELDARLGQPAQARAALAEAIAWLEQPHPDVRARDRCWVHGQVGRVHEVLGQLDGALEGYERAWACVEAEGLPGDERALHGWALAQVLVGRDRDRAVALMRDIVEYAPEADRAEFQAWLREHDPP
ncbi:MAG: serine/threonine protein kinase [Myxococcales bacterium]|nr:serine/threonine protein kinase [Myxococcales bacterium]